MNFEQIILLSWNHLNTNLTYRDRLALSTEDKIKLYDSAKGFSDIIEFTILSTCNRVEFYFIANDPNVVKNWVLNQYRTLLDRPLDGNLSSPSILQGQSAIGHLFRVAAGMKSMIIGEQQILSQVESVNKHILKEDNNMSGILLSIFSEAIKCGVYIHEKTKFGREVDSISYAAVNKANDMIDDIASRKILIIGAGNTAELTVKNFLNSGAHHIMLSNRSIKHGTELANAHDILYIPFDKLLNYLIKVDIVVTATKSMEYIINFNDLASINNFDKNIIFIDISNPRNIDPNIKSLENITLIDIDNLKTFSSKTHPDLKNEIIVAENLIVKYLYNYCNSIDHGIHSESILESN